MKPIQIKKAVTGVSLVCVAVSALLGIALLLKLFTATAAVGCTYLTLLTVFLTGLFLLNALSAIAQKNLLGYLCFGLLLVTALLFIVNIWMPHDDEGDSMQTLLKVNIVLAAVTVLFDFIVGNVITIKGKYLVLQLAEYFTFGYILFCVVALIFGNSSFFTGAKLTVLGVVALLAFTSLISLAFLKKSYKEKAPAVAAAEEEYVTLKKSEYQALLDKIRLLEEQNGAAGHN